MTISYLITGLGAGACLCASLAALQGARLTRDAAAARALRDDAESRAMTAVRLARLTAKELHDSGLALRGLADDLTARAQTSAAASLAGIAAHLLTLADELQDHGAASAEPPVLHDEDILLAPLLQDAATSVAATLGPSARSWRIDRGGERVLIRGDRRALWHVLTRVLGNAARWTGDGDWIDLSVNQADDGLLVTVEDEGAGLAVAHAAASQPAGSRGLGLGLALARVLMESHGGLLKVEARPRVGSRVTLFLPAPRVTCLPAPLASP